MTTNQLLFCDLFLLDDEVWDLDTAILYVTGYDLEDLCIRDRHGERAEARMIGMYFQLALGNTLERAGAKYNRDHATALHAKKTIKRYYGQKGEKSLTDKVNEISRLTGIVI